MAISITCPKCQVRLRAARLPDGASTVQCPHCGCAFKLPSTSVTTTAPAPLPTRSSGVGELDDSIETPPPLITRSVALALATSVVVVVLGVAGTIYMLRSGQTEPTLAQTSSKDSTGRPAEKKLPAPAQTPNKKTPAEPVAKTPAETDEAKQPENMPVVVKEDNKEEPKTEEPKTAIAKNVEDDRQKNKDFIKLMIQAGRDVDTKNYLEAVTGYTRALQLFPADEDARVGLSKAQDALEAERKNQKDSEKIKLDLAELNKQGKEAFENKQLAAASAFFKLALQKDPRNAEAAKWLTTVQEALAKDEEQKKKEADFNRFVASGQVAMRGGRYADAIRDFIAARQLLPTNPLPVQLQRQAEIQLANIDDQEKRKKELNRILDQAANAMRNQRLDDAEQLYQQALKLDPTDMQARRGLDDANRLLTQAKTDYNRVMLAGNQALSQNLFFDAANYFREALRLFPNDQTALLALRNAEQSYQRTVVYVQAMNQGRRSLKFGNFAEAVASYTAALSAAPNDPAALAGLREAQQLLAEFNQRQQEYDRRVQQAQFALKLQKYSDATQLFSNAFSLFPKSRPPANLQQQAAYADAMAKGQAALNMGRFTEAIPHYEAALRAIPGDFTARRDLFRAKAMAPNEKIQKK